MTIEDILKHVTKRAKNAFLAGSSTHFPFHTKDIDMIGRSNKQNPNMIKLKHDYDIIDDSIEDMRYRLGNKGISYCHSYYTVNKFKKNLAGNCQELSYHAFHELMKFHSLEIFNFYRKIDKHPIYIALCGPPEPYDHGFIVLYHPLNQMPYPIRELRKLQPDSWICDPWADIVCKGSQYPEEWNKKMRIWDDNNHCVISKDSQGYVNSEKNIYKQFFSPLREPVKRTNK
ncbi:hypothetical protein [Xenorhabdus sp. Sc-CR9]|uniref:hypothetical protein n=1 Tax=Xenorhabdus sp. Sc-CR9 TaxID=2584468 RepID=UPI001F28D834|nr:hypothetical protein [Xenorhabdus sp. Sc-CR9]